MRGNTSGPVVLRGELSQGNFKGLLNSTDPFVADLEVKLKNPRCAGDGGTFAVSGRLVSYDGLEHLGTSARWESFLADAEIVGLVDEACSPSSLDAGAPTCAIPPAKDLTGVVGVSKLVARKPKAGSSVTVAGRILVQGGGLTMESACAPGRDIDMIEIELQSEPPHCIADRVIAVRGTIGHPTGSPSDPHGGAPDGTFDYLTDATILGEVPPADVCRLLRSR
ncbi:MAG TPA: hypothetical protein VF407_14455 [Polyangiaceae bacterium]